MRKAPGVLKPYDHLPTSWTSRGAWSRVPSRKGYAEHWRCTPRAQPPVVVCIRNGHCREESPPAWTVARARGFPIAEGAPQSFGLRSEIQRAVSAGSIPYAAAVTVLYATRHGSIRTLEDAFKKPKGNGK